MLAIIGIQWNCAHPWGKKSWPLSVLSSPAFSQWVEIFYYSVSVFRHTSPQCLSLKMYVENYVTINGFLFWNVVSANSFLPWIVSFTIHNSILEVKIYHDCTELSPFYTFCTYVRKWLLFIQWVGHYLPHWHTS